MEGPGDYHTKWSKSERERQIYAIAYMWNLKKWYKWTYLQNRNGLTDLENKPMVTKGEKWGGRAKLGVWDWHIHTIIFKIGTNKDLLYSTRELCSIFYNNLNGKEFEKRIDTCICISESFCCTPETNTFLINHTPI